MKHYKNKLSKFIAILIGIILLFLVIIISWLYTGSLNTYKIKIFTKFPLPMAFINGKPIAMSDYIFTLKTNKIIGGNFSSSEMSKISYSAVVDNSIIEQIANKLNVNVSQSEINSEFNLRAEQTPLDGKINFTELLNYYGFNENTYKEKLIKPDLLLIKIKLWFNSQSTLNKNTYLQANNLLDQIKSGKDMGDLAKVYSQDEVEKNVSGDLGFLDISEILPELKDGIQNLKQGEAKILASRYGIHILKIEEINKNKLHIRQIFLNTEDFNKWLENEKTKIQIIKLLKV